MSSAPAPPSTLLVEQTLKTEFLDWCATKAAQISIHPAIELFHTFSENYRGVLAKEDIAEGTEVLRIARDICLGPQTLDNTADEWKAVMLKHNRYQPHSAVEADPDSGKAVSNGSSSSAEGAPVAPVTTACFTVLRTLHEQGLGDKSPFSKYLAILPRDHRIPLEWTDAELALLQGTAAEPFLAGDCMKGMYAVFQQLAAEHPSLWDPAVHTPEAFAKALNWVRSRAYNLEGGQPYMIPCADMFNHNPAEQSVAFGYDAEDPDVFVMRALKPIKAGSELFSSFGQLSNGQLVVSYGFVLSNNPFDSVMLKAQTVLEACKTVFLKLEGKASAGSDGADAVWAARVAQLREGEAIAAEQEQFVMTKYDMVPGGVLNTIQNALLTEDELAVYGTMMAVIAAKLQQYDSRCYNDAAAAAEDATSSSGTAAASTAAGTVDVAADALAVATALVQEERRFLKDLNEQLRKECLLLGDADEESDDSDSDDGSAAAAAASGSSTGKRKHTGKQKGKSKGKSKRRH